VWRDLLVDVAASAVRVGDRALPFRLGERRGADRIGLVGVRLDQPGGIAFLRAVADDLEKASLDEIGADALCEVQRIGCRVADWRPVDQIRGPDAER
jgi:hypothetical protein